jgi:hypothetical protein
VGMGLNMKCPNCGRFSKGVKVLKEDGESAIYSECSYCGRILLDKPEEKSGSEVEKKNDFKKRFFSEFITKTDLVKVSLIILFVMSAGLSGYLYYVINQDRLIIKDFSMRYLELHNNYRALSNVSTSIETYYEELQDMYSVLRNEYSYLEDSYTAIMQEKASLQNELHVLEDVLDLNASILLEYDKTLELSPEGNITLSYDTIYAGYLFVNFTASSDIYIWVGSSVTENEYYSRYPPFPKTAFNGTFTVPACAIVYININNPSEEMEAIVTLSISYIY